MVSSPNRPRRASGARPVSARFCSICRQCSNRLTAASTAAAGAGRCMRGCGDVAGQRVEHLAQAGVGEDDPQLAAVVWPAVANCISRPRVRGRARSWRSASSASRVRIRQREHAAAVRVPDGDEDVVGRLG